MSADDAKPKTGGLRLNLGTLEATRRSYCRLIRMMARHELDREDFRALSYGMNGLLQYWHAEKEIELEARLDALEAKVSKRAKDERLGPGASPEA
jgi:hypothetical protein